MQETKETLKKISTLIYGNRLLLHYPAQVASNLVPNRLTLTGRKLADFNFIILKVGAKLPRMSRHQVLSHPLQIGLLDSSHR